jgi:hypothetical protein
VIEAVVEGAPDAAAIRAIASHVALPLATVYFRSKPQILKGLKGFNSAARFWPWLVVVDLDSSAPCAPDFVREHLSRPSRHMRFRIAVREVEAWLMSDKTRMARFLGVPEGWLPDNPESLGDPKEVLVSIARRSNRREILEGMVPRPNSGTNVGPLYWNLLVEYITQMPHQWRIEVAAQSAPSLSGCIDAIRSLRLSLEEILGARP